MDKGLRKAAALVAALALAGCGPSLGRYDVTGLSVVEDLPDAIGHSRPPQRYLQVDLASDFDLVADGNGNIYPYKVECGLFGGQEAMVFGPLVAGDPPVDLYDAAPAMPRDARGKANYRIFVEVVAQPYAYFDSSDRYFGHDLATSGDDLCLEIRQAGYFLTESASRTIRIPSETVRAAIRRAGEG